VKLDLQGDKRKAGSWIPFAESRLVALKAEIKTCKTKEALSKTFPLKDVEVFIKAGGGQEDEVRIRGREGGVLIICYVGDNTLGYEKKYYQLSGNDIAEISEGAVLGKGWSIKDDGVYGKIWAGVTQDDPAAYAYTYTPPGNGLAVPEVDSGIATKRGGGGAVRILLAQAVEDELYEAFQFSFPGPVVRSMVVPADSLTLSPYKLRGRPSLCRYSAGGVITINQRVTVDAGSILRIDQWNGDRFLDRIPIVHRIYRTAYDGTRSYATINSDAGGDSAVIASVNSGTDQTIIRAETGVVSGDQIAEPIIEETYSLGDTPGFLSEGTNYHRCSNSASNSCGMLDANYITGKTTDGSGFTTNSGESTIADDIKLIHAVSENGLTYVRMEKDAEFTEHQCGVYVADQLIGESGWQPVITLYGDAPPLVAEENGPALIRQTAYRILHAHHDSKFDAAVYQKITYLDNSNSLLSYKWERTIGGSTVYGQFRKTLVRWNVEYFVVVNGVVHALPYECLMREYRLSVLSEDYVGAPITIVNSYYQTFPWVDVGYDDTGNPTGEDNKQITRIFTNASAGKLIVGYDVFPAAWKHDLSYNAGIGDLGVDFNEGIITFPPSVDDHYISPSNREWKLFKTDGTLLSDLTTPQDNAGLDVKRVNGLCMVSM
jgi:hypothetical protein